MQREIVWAYNTARDCRDKRSICHAPGYSMYFGRDGLVTACCYSRANPLGQIPDQTIAEIWFGKAYGKMRGEVGRNILPTGCETCVDQLRARNFKGLLAAQFDPFARTPGEARSLRWKTLLQSGKLLPYPSRMEFELSNKCNLECAMCSGFFSSSIRSNREKLPPLPQVYDKSFAQQIREFVPHLKEAKFFGGEPFLIDLYYEVWELFIELNPSCRVAITTNSTVFTEKVRRVVEKLNCQIIVSLDSLNKATYESIRVNATFEKTMANLDLFMEINREKNQPLSMAVCPMVSNWRELPEMVEFANRRGLLLFFNTVLFPEESSLKSLSKKKQKALLEVLRKALRVPTNPIEENNNRALEDVCLQVEMWMPEAPRDPILEIREQCEEYLERSAEAEDSTLRQVLRALAAYSKTADAAGLFTIEGAAGTADPKRAIRECLTAIWSVGARLTADALLPGAEFRDPGLQEYLRFLEESYPDSTLREIHAQVARFPMEVLQTAGSMSTADFIAMAQLHHPVPPRSAKTER